MHLKNKIIFLLFISFNALGKQFPELIAKQANENLRLISADGKYTYYQKRSGSLHLARNYKIIDVLKSNMGTQYTLYATPTKKKIAILQNSNFHTFYSTRMNEKIYMLNYGEALPREVGLGTNPALHLEDNWLSYYDFYSKNISFEHTTNYALKFSIKINNKINPYFSPQVIMPSESTVLYTDLSEKGEFGIINFNRNSNKGDIVYKLNSSNQKLEILKCQDNLIITQHGFNYSNVGTKIFKVNLNNLDFKKLELVYESTLDDQGHTVCDTGPEIVYFIKNTGDNLHPSFNVVELNLENKKINQLTELNTISTLINMDNLIISIDRGKYILIKGSTDFKNIDNLKQNTNAEEKN